MRELDEDTVRLGWLRVSDLSEKDLLATTKAFLDEQPPLFAWLTSNEASGNEEEEFQLALMAWQIVGQRDGTKSRPLPIIDAELLARLTKKRQTTIGEFLVGKQARSMAFLEAIDTVSGKVDFPQWALLGHLTEAIVEFLEAAEWTRAQAESAFVRLTIVVDAFDRVVKS